MKKSSKRRAITTKTEKLSEFAKQHLEVEEGFVEPKSTKKLLRVTNQTPIDFLFKRNSLDQQQWQAANEMAKFFYLAGIQKLKASDMSKPFINHTKGTSGNIITDGQMYARKNLKACIRAMGRMGAGVALDICCYEYSVKDVAKKLNKDERYIMERLREALDDYAVEIGFKQQQEITFAKMNLRENRQ